MGPRLRADPIDTLVQLGHLENRDARTLHPNAQEELRGRGIKMLLKGHTQQSVADILGVTRQAVGKWWKKYKEGGWTSVKKQKRGPPPGGEAPPDIGAGA